MDINGQGVNYNDTDEICDNASYTGNRTTQIRATFRMGLESDRNGWISTGHRRCIVVGLFCLVAAAIFIGVYFVAINPKSSPDTGTTPAPFVAVAFEATMTLADMEYTAELDDPLSNLYIQTKSDVETEINNNMQDSPLKEVYLSSTVIGFRRVSMSSTVTGFRNVSVLAVTILQFSKTNVAIGNEVVTLTNEVVSHELKAQLRRTSTSLFVIEETTVMKVSYVPGNVYLAQGCTLTTDCKDPDTVCTGCPNVCTCGAGFYDNNHDSRGGYCEPKKNNSIECASGDECAATNSMCDATCQCQAGRYLDGTYCVINENARVCTVSNNTRMTCRHHLGTSCMSYTVFLMCLFMHGGIYTGSRDMCSVQQLHSVIINDTRPFNITLSDDEQALIRNCDSEIHDQPDLYCYNPTFISTLWLYQKKVIAINTKQINVHNYDCRLFMSLFNQLHMTLKLAGINCQANKMINFLPSNLTLSGNVSLSACYSDYLNFGACNARVFDAAWMTIVPCYAIMGLFNIKLHLGTTSNLTTVAAGDGAADVNDPINMLKCRLYARATQCFLRREGMVTAVTEGTDATCTPEDYLPEINNMIYLTSSIYLGNIQRLRNLYGMMELADLDLSVCVSVRDQCIPHCPSYADFADMIIAICGLYVPTNMSADPCQYRKTFTRCIPAVISLMVDESCGVGIPFVEKTFINHGDYIEGIYGFHPVACLEPACDEFQVSINKSIDEATGFESWTTSEKCTWQSGIVTEIIDQIGYMAIFYDQAIRKCLQTALTDRNYDPTGLQNCEETGP